MELVEWRWNDLHSINSTLTLSWGSIPPICLSLLSPPPQTVHISWLLPWMGGAALASILHVAGHPSPSHHCRPIVVVQLQWLNCCPWITAIVVIDIVAISGGSGGIITIATAITITISAINVVAVIVNIASSTSLCHHCCWRAPWRPIWGIGPNHTTEALPMECGWCPYPWIGRLGSDGIDTRTLNPWCCPVGNVMVFEQWRLELRYPTVDGTVLNLTKLCWYIFIISGTTKTQVNHDNKIVMVQRRGTKLALITLVNSQGHSFGATRSHELTEATLYPKGAPADRSAISARRTNWNQSFRLKSISGTDAQVVTYYRLM